MGIQDEHKNADGDTLHRKVESIHGMSDYKKVWDFDSLYRAFRKSRRGKRWKYSAARFESRLMEELTLLSSQLQTKRYRLSKYNTFMVFEPKQRLVMSNSFRDKIVQHALCDEVLEPAIIKGFIYDNYASQKGKGTHFGLDRLTHFMRKYYRQHGADGWVLKCDIRKYFYMIRHEKLKAMLRPLVIDDDCWWLTEMIIDSTPDGVGIPIGNQSSQLFALLYLSGLDHYIKEKLGVKFYGRYMDDFYIIHHDKEFLKRCRLHIEMRLRPLGLELNEKTQIFPLRHGIDFLGFRTYLTDTGKVVRKVRNKSKHRMRRKLKKMRHLLDEGRIKKETIEQSYQSWRGHVRKGNSYYLTQDMDRLYRQLFED